MTTLKLIALVAAVCAIAVPVAHADSSPVDAVKADVSKLLADAQARHDLLVADADKIAADAHAAIGGDKDAAKATLKADREKFRTDWLSTRETLLADRHQLYEDLEAVRHAKAGNGEIRPLLADARATLRHLRADVRDAVHAARQAVRELRASFRDSQHHD